MARGLVQGLSGLLVLFGGCWRCLAGRADHISRPYRDLKTHHSFNHSSIMHAPLLVLLYIDPLAHSSATSKPCLKVATRLACSFFACDVHRPSRVYHQLDIDMVISVSSAISSSMTDWTGAVWVWTTALASFSFSRSRRTCLSCFRWKEWLGLRSLQCLCQAMGGGRKEEFGVREPDVGVRAPDVGVRPPSLGVALPDRRPP